MGLKRLLSSLTLGSSDHIFRGRKDLMQDYVNLSTSVSTANNVNGLRAVGHGTLPVLVTDVESNETCGLAACVACTTMHTQFVVCC